MRATVVAAMSVIAGAGCTPVTDPPTPESARIEVVLLASKADAYERTLAAFVSEGANVASGSAEGGVITSVPVDFGGAAAIYRAALLTTGDSVRVVLSAASRHPMRPERPLHSQQRGGEKAWQRLERIADRLRSGS